MRISRWLLIAGSVFLFSGSGAAHARLDKPLARDTLDNHKDPNGPCGTARNAAQPVTVVQRGQTLQVEFTETVNHAGCFLIDYSLGGDANFQLLKNVKHSAQGVTPRPYSTDVTLPQGACDATGCTLRLRQIMLASDGLECPPQSIESGVTYYACANLMTRFEDGGTPPIPDAGVVAFDASAGSDGGGAADGAASAAEGGIPTRPDEPYGPSSKKTDDSGGCACGVLVAHSGVGPWLLGVTAFFLRKARLRSRSRCK